jgi:transcription antitermination factor NusG
MITSVQVDRTKTERGEARPKSEQTAGHGWSVLWTRSNCEKLVHDQLRAKGFDTYLPTGSRWSTRAGVRHRIQVPMFPTYLFIRGITDKNSHVEVRKARGLVQVLGERWDRPQTVPERDVDAIRELSQSAVETQSIPYVKEGQRVRVVFGPLKGIEGILVRSNDRTGLLVLSIAMLQRSVAAEIHCSAVVPV